MTIASARRLMLDRMSSCLFLSGYLQGRIISILEENLMFTFGILFQVLFRRERSIRDTKVSETGLQAGPGPVLLSAAVLTNPFHSHSTWHLIVAQQPIVGHEWRPRLGHNYRPLVTHTLRPFIHSFISLFAQGHLVQCKYVPHPTLSLRYA